MRALVALGAGALIALAPVGLSAQNVSVSAEVGASARVFPETALFGEQTTSSVSPSLLFAPEVVLESDDRTWSLVAEGFLRLDAHDANRTHFDVRELGVEYLGDRFTAFAGFGQVFWGVTEVRHLVDVVNQIDAVEDLDGEDKLGQPMVSVTLEGGWGALDLYYLPYFRERTFPAADARLRGPFAISDAVTYTEGQGRWSSDFAARAFQTVGAFDVGLSYFRGTAREPRFTPAPGAYGRGVLRPAYDLIDQVGLDAQWTGEQTLLKLEAISQGGHGERIHALSAGIERTAYQVFGSDGDLGLLAELMLDSRSDVAPPTIFEHDVFLGARWALNDIADTSVLGGPLIDVQSGEMLVLLEAERRVRSDWRLSADVRLFANAAPGSFMYGVRNDSYVSLSLTRFF